MNRITRPFLAVLFVVVLLAAFPLHSSAQTPGYLIVATLPAPPSIDIPDGGTAMSQIVVIPVNGFNGRVSFTCNITGPAGLTPLPTCSLSPASINVPSAVTSIASITSTKTTATGTFNVVVSAISDRGAEPLDGPQTVPIKISHSYIIKGDGGGMLSLVTFAALLVLFAATRLRRNTAASR